MIADPHIMIRNAIDRVGSSAMRSFLGEDQDQLFRISVALKSLREELVIITGEQALTPGQQENATEALTRLQTIDATLQVLIHYLQTNTDADQWHPAEDKTNLTPNLFGIY